MGTPSDAELAAAARNYGTQTYTEEGRRYQNERELAKQDQHLPLPNGAFSSENRFTASPASSTNGRDIGDDPQRVSGERNRSRARNGRTASGQLRLCKKCGEPLTGQFVRALGGTFHLDCFRCRVCRAEELRKRGANS